MGTSGGGPADGDCGSGDLVVALDVVVAHPKEAVLVMLPRSGVEEGSRR